MKKSLFFLCILLSPLLGLCKSASIGGDYDRSKKAAFTENKGQMHDFAGKPVPFVLFRSQGVNTNVFITEKGLTYCFYKTNEEAEEEKIGSKSRRKKENDLGEHIEDHEIEIEWNRVDVELKGAVIKRENIIKEGESSHFDQFFLGHCPSGINDVRDYKKITIKEVYPGIDWVFYGSSDNGMKYDFIVHENGDPANIQLSYISRRPITLNEEGEIEIKTLIGKVKEHAPISFIDGRKIESRFSLRSKNQISVNTETGYESLVTFDFSAADLQNRTADLIIDPQLTWATFFGGTNYEGPMTVTNDAQGNTFVAGYVFSFDFPTLDANTFFQATSNGSNDVFVSKFNANAVLLWSTYIGGAGLDVANFVAADNFGNIFLTGLTSSYNLPTFNSGGYYQPNLQGSGDAFIMKFSNSGNLLWSTYFGGNSVEQGYSIAFDNSNNLFVVGYANSTDLPVQTMSTFFQAANAGAADVFITKFSNAGSLLWSTYYGGIQIDYGYAACCDSFGNLFVSGVTYSSNFPTLNNSTYFQNTLQGTSDGFVLKFTNSGVLVWATYISGSGSDAVHSVLCDQANQLYIQGVTQSTSFPVLNSGGFFQGTLGGSQDIFLMKFSNAGALLWSTYVGGPGPDKSTTFDNIARDGCGNIYFAFETQSTSGMPLQSACSTCYFGPSLAGGLSDIFLMKFNSSDAIMWSTYFGGMGFDFRHGVSCDNNNNFFVTGEWIGGYSGYSVTDPGGGAYYVGNSIGSDDGYIARFAPSSNLSSFSLTVCAGVTSSLTVPSVLCVSNAVHTLVPGPIIQSSPVFTFNLTSSANYTVYSGNSSSTNTTLININVSPVPSLTPTVFNGSCSNPTTNSVNLNLSFNPNTNPNYTVTWSPIPTTVTTVNSATAAGLVPGINNVTITTANGCTAAASFSVPPIPLPASFVMVNPSNDYTVTCSNPNVLLTTSVTNGVPLTYMWTPSCTNTLVGASMNFSQACTGQVVGTSSTGCTMTQTYTIYQDFTTPTTAITPSVNSITCTGGGGCFTLTSNLGPNVTTNWFQIVGASTVYVGAAQGTVNIFCAGQPGVYWGESVYNITGCRVTQSVQVTASVGVPQFTVTSPTNFTIGCSTKSVTSMQVTSVITSPVPNVAVNYTFMTPPVTGTPTTFTINPNLNNITIPGTYVVYIKDLTNNCVSSQSISIIQNTIAPNVNFIQPLPLLTCRDFSMVMTGISSNTNTQITWTVPAFPGSSVNPTPNATVVTMPSVTGSSNNVTAIGIWTVGAVDQNNFCSASKTVQINQDIRIPKFTITALTNSVITCKNSDVVIVPVITPSLAAALVPTYVWYPPVGSPVPGTSFNSTAPGTHTALSTSVVNGCTASATYVVATDLLAPELDINSTFTLDCNDNPTVSIYPTIVGSTTGFTYSWTAPFGALTSSPTKSVLTSNMTGVYFIVVTNTINGCVAQSIYQVVEGGIKANFSADPDFGFAPYTVNFNNTSSTSTGTMGIKSVWGFGNGVVSPTLTNNTQIAATYTAPGTYSVILTVRKGSCVDSKMGIITVELPSKIEIPNVFTPNGDQVNDVFRLRSSSLQEVYIVIYDRWGSMVYEVTSDTGNFAWDGKAQTGKECTDGTYFYVIKAKGKDLEEYDLKGNVSLFR